MRLTTKEHDALELFRDEAAIATARVPREERRALEHKGFLRGPDRYNQWSLTAAGRAALLGTLVRLTDNERRSLRHFRNREQHATVQVHGKTRHALEHKGLLRGGPSGRVLTAAGRAALATLDVPNIFDDLFPKKKEA